MAEYIEREALREAFIKHFDAVYDNRKLVFSDNICTAEDCEDILKLVAELPTADVVHVVRCRDCENYNIFGCADGFGWCESFHNGVTDEHYCSHGKRRCEE